MIAILPVKEPEKLGRMRAAAQEKLRLWTVAREAAAPGGTEHLQPPPGADPQVLSVCGADAAAALLEEPLLSAHEMTGTEAGGWVLCAPRMAPEEAPVLWLLAAEAPDAETLDALARAALAAALRRGVEQAAAHPADGALCGWLEKTAAAAGLQYAAGAPLPAEALLRCPGGH